MKLLLSLLIMANFAFANYTISFKGITLGEIDNFDSLENNYLESRVTNKIARFLLGKDKFVFFNDDFNGEKNDDTKYKKDNYAIIYILKKAAKNDVKPERIEVKKDKFIEVNFDKNYNFTYNSRGRIKSKGTLQMQDGTLKSLIETVNDIEIIKKN